MTMSVHDTRFFITISVCLNVCARDHLYLLTTQPADQCSRSHIINCDDMRHSFPLSGAVGLRPPTYPGVASPSVSQYSNTQSTLPAPSHISRCCQSQPLSVATPRLVRPTPRRHGNVGPRPPKAPSCMPRPQHPTPHLPGGTLQVPSAPQRLGPHYHGFLLPWMGSGQQQLQPQLVGRALQQLRLQHLLPLGRAPRPLLPQRLQRLLSLLRRVPQQTQLQPQRLGLLVLGRTPQQLLPQHLLPLGTAPRQK